jgi:two-component system NtrC family sensor kinase
MTQKPASMTRRDFRSTVPPGFRELVDTLLSETGRDDSRAVVLGRICTSLLRFSGSDAVSLRLEEDGRTAMCRAHPTEDGAVHVEVSPRSSATPHCDSHQTDPELLPDAVLQAILSGSVAAPGESFSRRGSFWMGDTARPILLREQIHGGAATRTVIIGGPFPSLALIRVPVGHRSQGVLLLASGRRDFFSSEDIQVYEAVAQTLGIALAHHGAQWALRERVKELTCLYGIARAAGRPGLDLDRWLMEIVELLPPGWQYPHLTEARITLDGRTFSTAHFREAPDHQSAAIRVGGITRGVVEVVYTEKTPDMDEGPFLKEERNLLDEIARQVSLIVEQREAEAGTSRLQEQLRHAERLATVGQLSAGVAHELNEPLAAVLGFAELLKAVPGLSPTLVEDVDRIIKAALHGREIIRKLMIFTRQMPTSKIACDLNQIVSEGLYFLESRCAKQGIVLVHRLEPGLPLVMADPSQLQQALVNLVVNAVQAMPDGGNLTVGTRSAAGQVVLSVEDTGSGMSPDVQRRLFTPFFTTKDVGQGTGLGLAVVHGIVTAHAGTVHVKSAVGAGSSFELAIPIVPPSSTTGAG